MLFVFIPIWVGLHSTVESVVKSDTAFGVYEMNPRLLHEDHVTTLVQVCELTISIIRSIEQLPPTQSVALEIDLLFSFSSFFFFSFLLVVLWIDKRSQDQQLPKKKCGDKCSSLSFLIHHAVLGSSRPTFSPAITHLFFIWKPEPRTQMLELVWRTTL